MTLTVNELIEELENLKTNGWGNSDVCVFEELTSIYRSVDRIQGYCGTVLIIKERV